MKTNLLKRTVGLNCKINPIFSQSLQKYRICIISNFSIRIGACLLFILFLAFSTMAQNEGVPQVGDYRKEFDPWEVILYEHPNYTGMWIRYKMQPGMRQRLVWQIDSEMNDKVSSIQIGANVGVSIFEHYNFYADELDGNQNLEKSVAHIGAGTRPLNEKISSLIIYPKKSGLLGVWLSDFSFSTPVNDWTFFPLPEYEKETRQEFPTLDQYNLNKNANIIQPKTVIFRSPQFPKNDNLTVILYEEKNFQGNSLTLPGADGWEESYNLGDFQWSDRAASLRVRWIGPPLNFGPPPPKFSTEVEIDRPGGNYKNFPVKSNKPEDCLRACADDQPNCKAFTFVRGGVQGVDPVCYLKSEVVKPVYNPNTISGVISSFLVSLPPEYQKLPKPPTPKEKLKDFDMEPGIDRPGGDYKRFFIQGGEYACLAECAKDPNCKAFTWVQPGEQGKDAICWLKNEVTKPVAKSIVISGVRNQQTQIMTPGKLKFPTLPTTSAVPDIAGTWSSSVGLVYEIKQNGNQFTWFAVVTNEKGQGTLTGKIIKVSWSGLLGNGSTQGEVTKTDAQNRAIEIRWKNGAVFYRQ